MSQHRNFLFLRSIAFGFLAKVFGGLTILIALPLIGRSLGENDYALFLSAMSTSALAGVFISAPSTLVGRDLARAYATSDANCILSIEENSLGLMLGISFVMIILGIIALSIFVDSGSREVFVVSLVLVIAQCLFQFGDLTRVASRSDHISSLWLIGSTCSLLLAISAFRGFGVVVITWIYFGIPAVFQAAIMAHLWYGRRVIPSPRFGSWNLSTTLHRLFPLYLNQISQWSKLYLSGLILYGTTDAVIYGTYTTLILLIARLSNPLTLITRPLMPAYLDAIREKDDRWFQLARRVVIVSLAGTLLILFIGSYFTDPTWFIWILPSTSGPLNMVDVFFLLLLFFSHAFSELLTPLFLSSHSGTVYVGRVKAVAIFSSLGVGGLLSKFLLPQGMLIALGIGSLSVLLVLSYRAINKELRVTPLLDNMSTMGTQHKRQ